jgi:hypothetical protein
VPKHHQERTTPIHDAALSDDASGLTGDSVRPKPVLFGSARLQALLLEIARRGSVRVGVINNYYTQLVRSGLCVEKRDSPQSRHAMMSLNADHPAILEIIPVLRELLGRSFPCSVGDGTATINPSFPLGHSGPMSFHIMSISYQAGEPLDAETIKKRIPSAWALTIDKALVRLQQDGALQKAADGTFDFRADVPKAFRRLVFRLSDVIGDPKFQVSEGSGARVTAFGAASDGAPRLFGSDIRLRNLIALAVYGPMHYRDLRRLTGVNHLRTEGERHAPFGRAALVKTWATPDGVALALDQTHPLHDPIRRLLLKLAETYPPAIHVPRFDKPDVPSSEAWIGDRYAIFGGPIPTSILLTIGVYGWTFESLCESVDDSRDRTAIKKALHRFEKEGILEGDQPRGPGFNIRVLKFPESFAARDELMAVLHAYLDVWPNAKTDIEFEMRARSIRTRNQLRNRRLWPYEGGGNHG